MSTPDLAEYDASDIRIFSCPYCPSKFKRKEHLSRHVTQHEGTKSHDCDICGRQFSRRDALRRHADTHAGQVPDAQLATLGRATGPKACINCHKHKKRCSGGSPCTWCEQRKVPCRRRPTEEPVLIKRRKVAYDADNSSPSYPTDQAYGADTAPYSASNFSRTARSVSTQPYGMHMYRAGEGRERGMGDLGKSTSNYAPASLPYDVTSLFNFDLDILDHFSWSPPRVEVLDLPTPIYTDQDRSDQHEKFQLLPERSDCERGDGTSTTIPSDNTYESHREQSSKSIRPPPALAESLTAPDSQVSPAVEDQDPTRTLPIPALQTLREFHSNNLPETATLITDQDLGGYMDLFVQRYLMEEPLIHPSSLSSPALDWKLLLAAATVGATCSTAASGHTNHKILLELLRKAVDLHVLADLTLLSLENAQVILLKDICMHFSGDRALQLQQQFDRSRSTTYCQLLNLQEARLDAASTDVDTPPRKLDYTQWLYSESLIRLSHGVYQLQCLQYISHGLPPATELFDMTNRYPCLDNLWRCRDEETWHQLVDSDSAIKAFGPRLGIPLEQNDAIADVFTCRLRLLYLYVDDQVSIQRFRNSTLQRAVISSIVSSRGVDTGIDAVASVVSETAIKLLDVHSSIPLLAEFFGARNTERTMLYPTLLLIRAVTRQTLQTIGGWRSTAEQTKQAEVTFLAWLKRDPRRSRHCLLLSVLILKALRVKKHFNALDPISLMYATSFIWVYDRFEPLARENQVLQVKTPTLHLGGSLDVQMCYEWLHKGRFFRVHISGIGFLDGESSPARILREAQRILLSRMEWRGICQRLARHTSQMIDGKPISLD
ncbi:hypothetical protein BDZ85DRAFT_250889 [Elsinoe ampelina]|uniref:Fungal-specific transcription factor domain-containing protein n=1 Tax=Elsinoe ampelina TaxID=302913 RepID=A0A6A6G8X0_9PEZI|nr:hypothetical protein BDZ85DRAFT_250889 [Elsinoe ampelina]